MPGRRNGFGHNTCRSNMTLKQMCTEEQEKYLLTEKKREERVKREAYKKERKIESYLADDDNFPDFAGQLEKVGLQLRDIPGDGNCLFRALGDQLEGHCRSHYCHRQDVVRYMVEHRTDFEPFIEDDIPFETHIHNLRKLGVHAGNDAIVAFARLHQVNIMIHQLNVKPLMITGGPNNSARQLHISYHNGDHYSSVRKLNDNTESPANIRIQDESDKNSEHFPSVYGCKNKGDGYVRAVRGCQVIEEEVIAATKCSNVKMIRETLTDCDYDVDAAIAHLMQLMELTDKDRTEDNLSVSSLSTTIDSGIWSDNGARSLLNTTNGRKKHGMHFRDSLDGCSGYGSTSSNQGGARPKLMNKAVHHQLMGVSRHNQKDMKKEKKLRAEERLIQKFLASPSTPAPSSNSADSTVSSDMSPFTTM